MMMKRILFILMIPLINFLTSCEKKVENKALSNIDEEINVNSKYVIEAEELDSLIKINFPISIIDIRKEEDFIENHIEGAVNLWRPQIRDTSNSIEGLMATKNQLEKTFSEKGITSNDMLVLYDAKGNPDAIRLWWILQYYGFTNVKILNGGIVDWYNKKMSLVQGKEIVNDTTSFVFEKEINEKYYASKELLLHAIDDTVNYIILDTRTREEFNGEVKKGNAGKAGRIPNSTFINYSDAIDYDNNTRFRSVKDLKWNYKALNKNKTIITYCQSGVRSAHTTFVLTEYLGFEKVKNYDGSWLEWSNTDLPIEKDSKI